MSDPFAASKVPAGLDDVAAAVRRRLPRGRERLAELVRVPSVSADGHDPSHVRRSAEVTASHLSEAGLQDVRLIEHDGSPPYVYAERAGTNTARTVLLYAHHDVQPTPSAADWTTPPFEPDERDGRLYGRGASDDKGGVQVHVSAIEAWLRARSAPPLNVKVIIEGEEEVGSPHFDDFLAANPDLLRADAVVVCDAGNVTVGWPSITYLTRGIAEVYVTVSALRASVHSGYSGALPDALSGLVVALASLKDELGRPAVRGLADDARPLPRGERELVAALERDAPDEMGRMLLDGVGLVGDPATSSRERIWAGPSITVLGLDVPSVEQATNQLLASARAKVSIRLAPEQDPVRAARLVAEHLVAHTPWGMRCETSYGADARGWVCDPSGPAFKAASRALACAFGREPALLGAGGTLPLNASIEDRLGVPVLLTAVGDPACRAHGIDESVDLGDLARATLAEALLLDELNRAFD